MTVFIFIFQFGMKPTLSLYPFLLHAFFMSIFASVIGPFGGFFGSGFKRAFKIKDFGDMIPGHGGVMDRFDCQFLMATFVNVYIHSFIRMASPQKLLQQVTDCLTNYKSLRNMLVQVNRFQKHLFLHQLIHNMTIDCS